MSHPQFSTKANGLLLHICDKFRSLYAVRPTWKVLDESGNGELPAGFMAFKNQRLQIGTGRVDGSGEPGTSRSEDDRIQYFLRFVH
jgi:hypothetical protein